MQSVRGRYGAYRLMPGSKLPPLMLTDQEAVAVSVGLLFARKLAEVSFDFEVLEPPELLEAIKACAQRLLGQVKPRVA